jgi:hypothetical protein
VISDRRAALAIARLDCWIDKFLSF